MRTLVIGDIHGTSAALDALLEAVRLDWDDRLIFLGDYVDRGPDSKGVLDRLIALRSSHDAICLRGNHEIMMLTSRTDKQMRKMWLSVGGVQALASYSAIPGKAGTLDDVPPEHWKFLFEDCVDFYETATHIFVHANLYPELPLDEQPDVMLFWEFLEKPIRHVSGKTIICGHTSQKSGLPLDLESTICIDTHAYASGWLTCLHVESRSYWQANLLGKVRRGDL